MAKVTVNKPEVVLPPPTYTVELTQAELAKIVLTLGAFSPLNLLDKARGILENDDSYTWDAVMRDVAKVYATDPEPARSLYRTLADAFGE